MGLIEKGVTSDRHRGGGGGRASGAKGGVGGDSGDQQGWLTGSMLGVKESVNGSTSFGKNEKGCNMLVGQARKYQACLTLSRN